MEFNQQFVQFLIRAKQNTYAGHGSDVAPSRTASHDLRYEEGDFAYYDTYLGGLKFVGEEAVWVKGKPVWGMNYYGWMLVEEIPDGFGDFLKDALYHVTPEAPYRGPEKWVVGDFEFHCWWQGSVERYQGGEYITWKGDKIYELVYHGGEVE